MHKILMIIGANQNKVKVGGQVLGKRIWHNKLQLYHISLTVHFALPLRCFWLPLSAVIPWGAKKRAQRGSTSKLFCLSWSLNESLKQAAGGTERGGRRGGAERGEVGASEGAPHLMLFSLLRYMWTKTINEDFVIHFCIQNIIFFQKESSCCVLIVDFWYKHLHIYVHT